MGGALGPVITCRTCGKHQYMKASYNCQSCDTSETLGPRPEGIPHARPCPGCDQNVRATNITCTQCSGGSTGDLN